jgi:hypothetical protein
MTTVYQSAITAEIEIQKAKVAEWIAGSTTARQRTRKVEINGMVPGVVKIQMSPRKFHIGWRFVEKGAQVGDIQTTEKGTTHEQQAEIMWVWAA